MIFKMNSFYIHLPSNVKDSFGKNTISNYITCLSSTLRFDGNWEVGLAEIIYKKSWYNLNTSQLIAVVDENGKVYSDKLFYIEEGYNPDKKKLLLLINRKVLEICKILAKNLNPKGKLNETLVPPSLFFSFEKHRVFERPGQVANGRKLEILLPEELSNMLGVSTANAHLIGKNIISNVEMEYEIIKDTKINDVDMNAGIHTFYVYSDIVKPSFVGDTYSKILRVVQVPNVKFGDSVKEIFDTPHYYQLSSKEISSIEIDIKDDTNNPIKFRFGRVVVVLHFKKNE